MNRLELNNLSHKIADMIENMIIKMDIQSGERLLEAKLAKDLSVSQGTIREALRILEKRGLVVINQRRGTMVVPLEKKQIESLYDILTELYTLLTRKAMSHYSKENVNIIKNSFAELETLAESRDTDGYYNWLFEFATLALRVIDDPLLESIINGLWHRKKRIEFKTLSLRKTALYDSISYFKKIKKYLIENDTEMLIKCIREYTQNEKKVALSLME